MVNHPPAAQILLQKMHQIFGLSSGRHFLLSRWYILRRTLPPCCLMKLDTGLILSGRAQNIQSPMAFKERINSPREKYKTSLEFWQIIRTPVSLCKNLKRWYEKIRLKLMTKIIFICQTSLIDFWNQFYSFSNTVDQCSFVLRCFLWLELIF